jgi:hypothetical protein
MRATGPSQPALLLLDVLDILQGHGIPHAIVGALAVSYYGVPRASIDADAAIWLQGTGRDAGDLKNALAGAGYTVKLRRGDIDDPIAAVIAIEDAYGNAADLLIGIRGMAPDVQTRCVTSVLFDTPVRIMGAEDLVAMKVFAGGPFDLADVRGIFQVSGESLNIDLLRKSARGYGKQALETLTKLLVESGLS